MKVRRRDGGMTAVEIVGKPGATPVLLCHGLADCRLAAHRLGSAAVEFGLRVIAPDRPGVGGTAPRRLARVVDWVADAVDVLDALDIGSAQVLGISGGGAFAAALAARAPERFTDLVLVAPLGPPEWPTVGMERWQRRSMRLGVRSPDFGGWFLGRMGALARRDPELYVRLISRHLPEADRRALAEPDIRGHFLADYLEAFRQGSGGVAQDLRLLTRPWGFALGEISLPTVIHHGTADTVVPPHHAQRYAAAIPGARVQIHPGHGHFSIPGRFAWLPAPG